MRYARGLAMPLSPDVSSWILELPRPFTANYAKLKWVKELGLRPVTVDYAYLS
jgi:hypothetical protein